MITIESAGSRRIPVRARTEENPTASPPEFCLTTGERANPGTFVSGGSWVTAYNVRTGRADALTPLVGAGQALNVEAGKVYDLWIRYATPSGAHPEERVGSILVR
jgi:hypothetical protein